MGEWQRFTGRRRRGLGERGRTMKERAAAEGSGVDRRADTGRWRRMGVERMERGEPMGRERAELSMREGAQRERRRY